MYRDAKLKYAVYFKQLIHSIPHPNTHTHTHSLRHSNREREAWPAFQQVAKMIEIRFAQRCHKVMENPTQYASPNPPHPKASSRGHRAQGVWAEQKQASAN